ncbi:MAG: helix-turn-helix transcriptional regulator [Candidatus Omnitrophica bacterium]|nr:helix-turn-helix transcriptional regulator [Candidatus Omnitrophota bacterium]
MIRNSIKETKRILKDPAHPEFPRRMTVFLMRCDKPKELFSVISKEKFVQVWPRIRGYWIKRMRRSDSRDWWETIYEQLTSAHQSRSARIEGGPSAFLRRLGALVKEARIESGLSQRQLALRIGMRQPDISRIEEGKQNITLFTLARLCKVLGIRSLEVS